MALSQVACDHVADSMEQYLSLYRMCVILTGGSEKKFKKVMETLEDGMKKLHKGKTKKVIDPEMAERLGPSLEYEARHKRT